MRTRRMRPKPPASHFERWPTAAIALLIVLATAVVTALAPGASGLGATAGRAARTPSPARVDARVTLAAGSPISVPRSFLGISAEYWTIPIWAREPQLLRRVFSLLSTDGPARLRIGGDSADRSQWSPTKELPEWVFELTPSWLRQTSSIVRQTGTRLILDLNTMSSTPQLAARWAKTAIAGLPQGSIRAFEVGNEPDIYNQSKWQHLTAGRGAPPAPSRITAESYARSFGAYARAVARVDRGVPLLAPALAEPQRNSIWISKLLAFPHPKLTGITAHRYPYSACARPGAPTFPSIPRVLSENATAGMGRTALDLEHITDPARLPLWMTEINSVTCGGTRGVSNAFATALWAPDALLELIKAGTEAAFVHVRPPLVNMAFSLTRKGLTAHPLLYGLALFARMLAPGAQLVPLRLAASRPLDLKTWAVRANGRVMHVLLLNKGARDLRVRLELPHLRVATVQWLRAPNVSSTTGVTLAGQRLTRAATWAGKPRTQRVTASAKGLLIGVPRYSAALIATHLR
ncbi:MAG: hypothetical protein KGL16_04445 [Acidobacteriota bacterium]|nr:hypothetical protein [Acidobacteriota bacterium]